MKCARTKCEESSGVVFFNPSTGQNYCTACAQKINSSVSKKDMELLYPGRKELCLTPGGKTPQEINKENN